MSLINQVLQDLEARRADGAERADLPKDVRPLPSEQGTPWRRIALGAIVTGLLAAGAIVWLRGQEPVRVQPVAATAPAPVPPVPALLPQAPAASTPIAAVEPPQPQPMPQAVAPPPPALASIAAPAAEAPKTLASPPPEQKAKPPQLRKESVKLAQEGRLKVATSLSVPREVAEREPSAVATRPSVPAATPSARTGEGPPSIEKQVRLQTSHDRAENEYRKAAGLLN